MSKFYEIYPDGIPDFETYQREVRRTLNPQFDVLETSHPDIWAASHFAHLVMGIHDEFYEFREAAIAMLTDDELDDVVKELGDVCWYLANLCNRFDVKWSDGIDDSSNLDVVDSEELFVDNSIELLGHAKKSLAYPSYFTGALDMDVVSLLLTELTELLNYLSVAVLEIPILTVMNRNLEKLYNRYPEKFTGELAINKDESDE